MTNQNLLETTINKKAHFQSIKLYPNNQISDELFENDEALTQFLKEKPRDKLNDEEKEQFFRNRLSTKRTDKFEQLIYEGDIIKNKAKYKKQMIDYCALILYLESKKEFVLLDFTADTYPTDCTILSNFEKIGTIFDEEALKAFKKSFWTMSEAERLSHIRKKFKTKSNEILRDYLKAINKIKAWGIDLWDKNQTCNTQEPNIQNNF